MEAKQRKHFTNQEKVMILKQNLVEKKPISEICDKYKLHPSVYHRWQREFFENADKVLVTKTGGEESELLKKVKELEEKLKRKNEVLSELMEEHIALKKKLGGN